MCFLTSEIRQPKLTRGGLWGALRITRPPSWAVSPSYTLGCGRPSGSWGHCDFSGESCCPNNNTTCFHTRRWQVGRATYHFLYHKSPLTEVLVPGADGREGTEDACPPGLVFRAGNHPQECVCALIANKGRRPPSRANRPLPLCREPRGRGGN